MTFEIRAVRVRHPQLGVWRERPEAGGKHANDLCGLAIEPHGFADRVRLASEASLPKRVAQHHQPLAALRFRGRETAAERRVDPELCEQPRRGELYR